MADTVISLSGLTTPEGADLVPIARAADTTARHVTLESVINKLVGGDASSNTPDQDNLGVAVGLNNTAAWGAVAIGLNNGVTGTAYQSGSVGLGEGNTVDNAHAFGRSNSATNDGYAIGDANAASGNESVGIGFRNTVTHEQAVVIGHEGTSRLYREHIESFGSGYGYLVRHLLSKTTTNATPAVMGLTGAEASKLTVRTDSVMVFTIRISALTVDAGLCGAWVVTGAIKNAGGSVSLLGTIATTFSGADAGASGWQVAVTANDSDNCLEITVTGAAGTTIEWYALVEALEHHFT